MSLTILETLVTLILIKLGMNFWLPDYVYTSTKISNVQGMFLPLKSEFNAHDVRINDATLVDIITSCSYPPVEPFVMLFVLACETKGSGSFVAAYPAKGPFKCHTKNDIFQHTVPTHLHAFYFPNTKVIILTLSVFHVPYLIYFLNRHIEHTNDFQKDLKPWVP